MMAIAGLSILLGAGATACGSEKAAEEGTNSTAVKSDESSSSSSGGADQEDLEKAVKASMAAVIDGDTKESYSYLSDSCHEKLTSAEWGVQITMGKQLMEGFTGMKMSDYEVTDVEVRNVTSTSAEGRAVVLNKDDGSRLDDEANWLPWVVEDGEWKTTSCETIEESMSSSNTTIG